MARRILPPSLAAIAAVVLGLPTLVLPLHPDQALFAMVGKAIAAGRFPYVDVWDFKTPGLYLVYTAAIHGPFEIARNIRLFNLGWTAASAVLLVELGRRWWDWRAGLIAALVYSLVCAVDTPFWLSAQPDSLAVLPILLALLLFDAGAGRRGWLVAAGLLLGFACQIRITALVLLPLYPVVAAMTGPPGKRFRIWLRELAWLAIGAIVVQVPIAGCLVLGGAFGQFLAAMRYAAGYTRLGGAWDPPGGPTLPAYLLMLRQGFWGWASPRLLLTLPALVAAAAGSLIARKRRVIQLSLFVLASYAGLALQGKFFWYHYGIMVPFLALLGGWGWDRLLASLEASRPRQFALLTAAALSAVLLLASPGLWDNGVDALLGYRRYLLNPSQRAGDVLTTPGWEAERTVAVYLRDRTNPDDSIYVWGFDPALYLLSGRTNASRFLLEFPQMSSWAPAAWRSELVDDLRNRSPAYIVVLREYPGYWIVGNDISAVDYIGRYPELQQLLASDYEQETEIADRILYRRR